jgi:mono/diheme cytochrome c family protein
MVWLGCSEIFPQRTQGERLYRRWCAGCHGVDGTGRTPRYMAIPHANLLDDNWTHGGSEGAIKAVIRDGVLGKMPANDHLSAEEVDAIYEHLMVLRARARDQPGMAEPFSR